MASSIQLEISTGAKAGQQICVGKEKVTFGRTNHADVVMDWDSLTSAIHFQIHFDGSDFSLLDLGSTNGTFLNEQRVTSAAISNGDVIQVGETKFVVKGDGETNKNAETPVPFNPFASTQSGEDKQPVAVDTVKSGQKGGIPEKGLSHVVLRIVSEVERDATFKIESGQPTTFGRTNQSDVSLSFDGMLSSQHFRIVCKPDSCRLEDLRSANGTWHEGKRIDRVRLNPGDNFRAGRTKFVAEFEHAAEQSKPSPVSRRAAPTSTKVTLFPGDMLKWQSEEVEVHSVVDTIGGLSSLGMTYLLVDFSKFEFSSIPELAVEKSGLFDWLPEEASLYSPHLITINEFDDWPAAVSAGWYEDAIVCLVSQHDQAALLAQLRGLTVWKSGPSSTPSAIRGICWPGVLQALLENDSQSLGERLFESCDLAIMQSFDPPKGWQAFGLRSISDKVGRLGFASYSQPVS